MVSQYEHGPEDLSDWSSLPKDIYVVSAKSHGGIAFDVTCCSVPMIMVPEVRYTRADLLAAPDTVPCERCQGNGEIVIDWDKHLSTNDEGVAECPDCDGSGRLSPEEVRIIALMAEKAALEASLEASEAKAARLQDAGEALVRQLSAVINRLDGQAYSSTLSALNYFKAAMDGRKP